MGCSGFIRLVYGYRMGLALCNGEPRIDHVGTYLGTDSTGHHRFLSSGATANGPTMGDLGGTALLDDGGYYSRSFRAAERL